MKMKKSKYMNQSLVKQYPLNDLKDVIYISTDIVEIFLIELEEGFNYDSTSICSYEKKYSTSISGKSSKIESLLIKNMSTEDAMRKFLNRYYSALASLNNFEKIIFVASFVEGLTDLQIIEEYNTNSKEIRRARDSAVVKFSIKSGLYKFIDVVY